MFFDQLVLRFTRGSLNEEARYYPHGLPMAAQGSTAVGHVANRHKYQSNEYKTELGLNWMDFQNRQNNPQIGRFLSIDPLADDGQEEWSPYAAMGNNPAMMVDPLGLKNYMHDYHSTTTASPVYGGAGRREYRPGRNADEFNELNAALAAGAHDLKIRSQFYEISGMFKGVGTGLTAGNDLTSDGGNMAISSSHTNDAEGTNGGVELVFERKKEKSPGFWGRIANNIRRFLKWGDEKVTGHATEDVKKQQQPGGTEFSDPQIGVAHSGHTAKDPDGRSVRNSRYLLTLGGGWGTNPSAMWSNWKSSFDFFTNTYNLTTDATSSLNDVMRANGIGQPAINNEYKPGTGIRPCPNGDCIITDTAGHDNTNFQSNFQKMKDSLWGPGY